MQYDQLEAYLREAVADIRKRLAEADIGDFDLTIECSGRTHSGDALIEFKLSEKYETMKAASGGRLSPVIEEFLRRFAWNKRNAPLALGAPGGEPKNDSIPF